MNGMRCISALTLLAAVLATGESPAQTWNRQLSPVGQFNWSVKAVTPTVAWIGSSQGAALRTTDGGGSWSTAAAALPDSSALTTIDAIDENIAFASFANATATLIFRTTNGGASWEQVFSQTGGFINAVRMLDPTNGIAVGDPVGGKWTVARTSDGGATWARIMTEPTQIGSEHGWANSLAALGTNAFWFGTDGHKVYRTTDGGATWSWGSTTSADSYGLWFNDSENGVASCGGGVYQTTNGGQTWTGTSITKTAYAASGSGGVDFWIMEDKTIHRSSDRGQTWTTSFSSTFSLNHLSFVTAGANTFGWAVGDSGGVLAYAGFVTGTDILAERIPRACALSQNYPNPFNSISEIGFRIAEAGEVTLKAYDLLGREVAVLVDGRKEPGFHHVQFDASNLASGVYLYRLTVGPFVQTRKLALLR